MRRIMQSTSLLVAALCFFFAFTPTQCTSDVCLTARSYGYECQEYTVTTEDGFILGLQRIPKGLSPSGANATVTKPPVLLQHGILMDGLAWAVSAPGQGLAFTLADAGFDVWIANARGTRPSRAHKTLNADIDQAYWAWTWVELANFDLSANVNFVHNVTGQKLYYVGHSLGTLMALASFSQHKLTDKVNAAALLSPIAFLNHMTTGVVQLAANVYGGELLKLLGIPEFVPESESVDVLLKTICSFPGLNCSDLLSVITVVRSGNLIQYDYGDSKTNTKYYGQAEPPAFNLTNIPADFPLLLSYGGMDAISDVRDVGILLNLLKPGHPNVTSQLVDDYAHADFIMASDAKEKIHNPLIAFFNGFK